MAGRRRGRTGRGWDAAPPRVGSDGPVEPDPSTRRSQRRAPDRLGRSGEAPSGEPADPAERARQICLRLLAVRPRTRSELATALRRRGIDAQVAEEVLRRYGEVGMVDDEAFARAWVTSRHHSRGLARRALAAELRQRGIDSDTVGRALTELDSDTEVATARALVERKLRLEPPLRPPRRRAPGGDQSDRPEDGSDGDRVEADRWDDAGRRAATEALARRLVGLLARKGYPPGLAIRVVRDALAEWPGARDLDPDTDWDAGLVGDA
ncbi:MAG: regulatory protein RecX [Micromonosporaceae bacterium]|nr:regulatory protein RecX [Micromonosporaceae bacterium]